MSGIFTKICEAGAAVGKSPLCQPASCAATAGACWFMGAYVVGRVQGRSWSHLETHLGHTGLCLSSVCFLRVGYLLGKAKNVRVLQSPIQLTLSDCLTHSVIQSTVMGVSTGIIGVVYTTGIFRDKELYDCPAKHLLGGLISFASIVFLISPRITAVLNLGSRQCTLPPRFPYTVFSLSDR